MKNNETMLQILAYKIVLLRVILSISGYDISCPHPSQRLMRARDKCNDSLNNYTCLYDTEKKNYIEFCANRYYFVRPGLHYVITRTFRNVPCSDGRYQPIKFWSNQNSDCLFTKSHCNGDGQILFDNISTIVDATCRCDYSRGYTFVSKTRNPCFCTPSKEDCSCRMIQCPLSTVLSPDYECVFRGSMNGTFNCPRITDRHKEKDETDISVLFQDNEKYKDWMRDGPIGLTVLILGYMVIAGILVVIYRLRRRADQHRVTGRKPENSFAYNSESQSNEALQIRSTNFSVSACNLTDIGMMNLIDACKKGNLSQIHRFIEIGGDINITDNKGKTPFHWSCIDGNIYIARFLIDYGCDIHQPDNNMKTPLMYACYHGHVSLVDYLIKIGTDISMTDKEGTDAFAWSCYGGNINVVKLLADMRCDIEKPNNVGRTPLMWACNKGHISVVNYLIARGANVNFSDSDGTTPFSWSCEYGNIDIVNSLIFKGCVIDKPNDNGITPLMGACSRGHLPIVTRLIEHGADINITDHNGHSAFTWSLGNDFIDIINLLIDQGCDIHQPDNRGMTPLMNSCLRGNLPIVTRLIERGADINLTDMNGNTSCACACMGDNIDILNLLIDKGCDLTKQNHDGQTPLMHACLRGQLLVVKHLIERDVDINITDKDGYTASELSIFAGHFEIFNFLKEKAVGIQEEHTAFNNENMDTANQILDKGSDVKTHESNDADNPDYLLPFAGTSEDFTKLLFTGTYESFENRVFLCGSCACGKSTLASVLIGSKIPLTWKSTDGLVIHFGRNGINLETYQMVPLTGECRDQNVFTKVLIGKPNIETSTCRSVDINQDRNIAPSSKGSDNLKSNLQAKKKDTGHISKETKSYDAYTKVSQNKPVTNTIISDIKKPTSISPPQINKIEAYAVRDDILKEIKSGQYKIKIAPSDLVDFGGQRSYDMTHQLFIQHGGTFVVMFDGSKDFHEPLEEYSTGDITNESIVKHWVNSILTYCVDDNDVMPMILFAATHRDLLSKDIQREKQEFVKKVTEMFGTHEMKKHIVFDPVYFINGKDIDDHDIKNLKKQLVSIAVNQPSWGLRRPLIWVPLELLITNMKKENINFILKAHLAEANKMNGDLALSDKQLDDFLLTQHALGKIMFFNQPRLNNFIVIYPPALVNILRSFITDEMFWPQDKTLRDILSKMTNTGRIKKRDLLKLWQQEQVTKHISCDAFKEFVLQVLVHLDVLVVPKRHVGANNRDVDFYLVPCIAKDKMPMSFLDDTSFENKTISLVYRLRKRTIPSSLAFKLIGAVSGIWPIKEENGRQLLYHSSAVLCADSETEFRIIIGEKRVIVYLTHMSSKFTISPDIAASIQECLTFTLNDVLKFYLTSIGKSHTNIDVSNLFQIEVGEVCDRSPCVVSISEAKRTLSWICCRKKTHLTRYPLLWIFDKTQEECPKYCSGLHSDALKMLPSDKHLVRLANQLDIDSCKTMLLYLGLQKKDWINFDHKYAGDALTINTMALYTWMNTKIKGKSSTKSFNDLLEGLKEVVANRHLLCKVFREYTDLSEFPNVGPEEVLSDDVLNNLPKKLGNCALQLGVELGISINSIEQTKTDYRQMYDQIADILRKWKQCEGENPTVCKLMVVLERVHLGGFQFVKDSYLRK